MARPKALVVGSSGIQLSGSRISLIAKNYVATMAFLGFGYFYYSNADHFRGFLNANYKFNFVEGFRFSSWDLFYWGLMLYAAILIPFYALHDGLRGKALTAFEYPLLRLLGRSRPSEEGRAAAAKAARALVIKFFFAPLMVKWLFDHIFGMSNAGFALSQLPSVFGSWDDFLNAFNSHLYWFLFDLILFADVVFFTLGYLIESPKLRNEIVSAEPSMVGWVVCLLCYPPFNKATNSFIGWASTDFPKFADPFVHVGLNSVLLLLMGIYASASVALNWKASNLTNRGIVAAGPYRWVRHPAYMAKNTAWWIGGIPAIYGAFSRGSARDVFFTFLALAGTSTIYALRAITEEQHLLAGKNGYAEYMQKVKYRFIPGVL